MTGCAITVHASMLCAIANNLPNPKVRFGYYVTAHVLDLA